MDLNVVGGPSPRRRIKPRESDEIAESIKVTMRALKDYFGLKSGSQRERLRVIGSEFGHLVSRNIASSKRPKNVLREVSSFWTAHGLGEMDVSEDRPLTFSMRDCFDCVGTRADETLCGFKEGFINAILNDKSIRLGSVREVECCGSGAETCKFTIAPTRQSRTIKSVPHG